MAFVRELRIDHKVFTIPCDPCVDLFLRRLVHILHDAADAVIAVFRTDLFEDRHIVRQNVVHAGHLADHADLHPPQERPGLRCLGEVLYKRLKLRLVPVAGKELALESHARNGTGVILRAVYALIDGQHQLIPVIADGLVRLHNSKAERQMVFLQCAHKPRAL